MLVDKLNEGLYIDLERGAGVGEFKGSQHGGAEYSHLADHLAT